MGAVETALRLIPGLSVETIEFELLRHGRRLRLSGRDDRRVPRHGGAALLPAVRKAGPDAILVADGISCRHQIRDGASREAVHVARLFAASLTAAQQEK